MRLRSTRAHRLLAALASLAMLAAACAGSDDEGGSPGTTEARDDVVGTDALGYEATIRRTTGGIPHIVASDTRNLAFGQGWASGEDRACDLADQVVKIKGERSRLFGAGDDDANISSDLAWRAIGIYERAVDEWNDLGDETRQLMTAFVDGWNAHLAHAGDDGLSDWCAGEGWVEALEPHDVYAYARAVALQASSGALAQYIASAQPPEPVTTEFGPDTTGPPEATPSAIGPLTPAPVASNGWAIGRERSEGGGGMLVGNPHFPWEGELRFWEAHLTIPGQLDIYGVQLSGLPGIGIGFTDTFAWTHTVSAGSRFTAYRLQLVPGEPTAYVYGDEIRDMTSEDVTLEVLQEDGSTEPVTRTMWSSHYGPIIDFPGFGWSDSAVITFRDANIDNDEFIEQYLAMMQAGSLDELIDIHRRITGVPLFNTIAVSDDGRAWYADTSATPNLSDEALARYEQSLVDDPIVRIAADNRAILLDGSDPTFEWVDEPGARDPGLVPFERMPVLERPDHVFNANDSFWLAHADEVLEGDYSPLHGRQATPRTPRTRENATVLSDTSPEGPAGPDGLFSLDELADAALWNRGYTSRALREDVVARCEASPTIEVDPIERDGERLTPGGRVELGEACEVLAGWDGVYDTDRAGPPVWRELMSRFELRDLLDAGPLWAQPFDPAAPVDTPAGLAPAGDGGEDPVLERLGQAVQLLEANDVALDATLGELQVADRNGTLVPIHGGDNRDGTTNIVGGGRSWSTLDPRLAGVPPERAAPGSSLATRDGRTGYFINNGTSFLFAVAYGEDGPRARAFLTYGNTADRESPLYVEATERFSRKDWRDVLRTDAEIEAAPPLRVQTVRG